MPVGAGDGGMLEQIPAANDEEYANDGDLDDDDGGVEVGRFLDADDQDGGDDHDDGDGDEVDDAGGVRQAEIADAGRQRHELHPLIVIEDEGGAGGGGDLRWEIDVELLQEAVEVARPSRGDGGSAEGVFEAEVPANDPGDEFAERGVAIGVGGAGDGNDGGEFRIAETGEGTGESGDDEAESHGRTCAQSRGLAGEREDARADD